MRFGQLTNRLRSETLSLDRKNPAAIESLRLLYRKDPSLAPEQRYYTGTPPERMRFGSAWPGANFQLVDKNTDIAPDIHLLTLVSDKPGTLEVRELSLALNTPDGLVIVVGCSHAGIDKIVELASALDYVWGL